MPNLSQSEPRFDLILKSFHNTQAITEACQLLYHVEDSKLISAMANTPYTLGRGFSKEEASVLSRKLKELKIAHIFEARAPFNERIEWKPQQDSETKFNHINDRIKSKASSKSLWIGIFILLVLGGVLLTRFPNPKSITTSPGEPYIAQLSSLSGRVDIRKSGDHRWQSAKGGTTLKKGDGIRTFEEAQAILNYKEGSQVRIREQTLLIVGESISDQTKLERNIELENGSIRARMNSPEQHETKLSIHTAQGILTVLTKQEVSRFESTLTDDSFEVAFSKGKGEFRSRDQNESVTIDSLKKMTYREKTSVIEDHQPRLKVYAPPNNQTMESPPYRFYWEDMGEDTLYNWQVSADSNMDEILLTQETASSSVNLSFLDSGNLYWQVSTTIEGIEYKSSIRKIYVK